MKNLIVVILLVLSVAWLAGAQPLMSQNVGDRVRVTTSTGVVTGRVLAITESALDLSFENGRSESFSRTAINRLERSSLGRTTRSLHGFLQGTGVVNLIGLPFFETDRGRTRSETDPIAFLATSGILGGLTGAVIGLFRGEVWEDITFGSTAVAASNGRRTLVGVRAGYGYSSHTGLGSSSGIARMIAGVDVAVPLRSGIDLRIGAAFAPKGYGDVETVETDYVQGSVLARAGTPIRREQLSAGLLFGPWVAYGLSCSIVEWRQSSGLFVTEYVKVQSRPCGEEARSLDYGIAIGAAVGVPFRLYRVSRLEIDLMYSMGLGTHTTHIVPDYFPDIPEFADIPSGSTGRTRHLTIQTGFVIPVGN